MDRANEKLRELLSDKLGNFSAPVDPGLWAGVQSGLQTGAAGAAGSTAMGWLPWAAAAFVGLGIAAAVVFGPEKSPSAEPKPGRERNEVVQKPSESVILEADQHNKISPGPESASTTKTESVIGMRDVQKSDWKQEEPASKASNPSDGKPDDITASQTPIPKSKSANAAPTPVTDRLNVSPPEAKFKALPSQEDLLSFEFTPMSEENYVLYHWQFGDGHSSEDRSPDHLYNKPGEYIVSLSTTNVDGTTATEEMTIKAFPQGKLILPNIFTPDGDNINDFYDISATSENVEIVSLIIANQKGQIVFEHTPGRTVWDGNDKFGQPSAAGTYVVNAIAVEKNGDIIKQSGILHLKR